MTASSLLIVDDSVPMHKLIQACLKQDPIVTRCVFDGESALTMATEWRPSLILLDVDMPHTNGFDVCRRLRANRATAHTPVIFVTADADLSDKIRALDMGAVDYITKPFKPEELRARVRAALRTKHRLDKVSMVDGLTGLWNQAYLELHMMSQLAAVTRSGRPLACIAADIDRLEKINTDHDRAAGDQVIRNVGQILLSHCRTEDTLSHFGGGRFIAVTPGTKADGAARLAERVRAEIEHQLAHPAHAVAGTTCSFGISETLGRGDASLLDRADAALYQAKQLGRNRVCLDHPHSADSCAA